MLSIITVNYYSSRLISVLEELFESSRQIASGLEFEFIVVDNSGEFLPRSSSTIVVKSGHNQGFGMACNLGVERCSGDAILFINPDVSCRFADIVSCYEMLASSSFSSIVSAVIPNKYGTFTTLVSTPGSYLIYKRKRFDLQELKSINLVYVTGAFLMMSKANFDSIGGFSSDVFMYAEDVLLCKKAVAAGSKIMLNHKVQVAHIGGGSSSGFFVKYRRLFLSYSGHLSFMKCCNLSGIRAAINSIYLASGYSR